MKRKAFKAAFPHTVPIMAGYVFLGIAFGLLMKTSGYPGWLPILMSLIIYSGALEFAVVPLFAGPFDLVGGFLLGLMVSARHIFYGIPMLKKYEKAGKMKAPLVFFLTDETFSVSTTIDPPEDVERIAFYGWIGFLDYLYWTGGTALGVLCGNLIPVDLTGIDFALTALFIVLFIEQLKGREGFSGGFIGLLSTAAVLILFGSSNMVIISMLVILALLLLGKKVISRD